MSTRLYVSVGVGGVGKTTISAAIALALSKQGIKTLVITIDPARRLAQDLGIDSKIGVPQKVGNRQLYGMMLDIKSTFDQLIRRLARAPEKAERIISSSIYQHMTRTLIGTQEYMALEELHRQLTSGEWEAVVLDTPPAKHVVDFFEAPKRLASFFGGPSARWVSRFAKGTRLVVKAFTLLWGNQFLTELAGFFGDMEDFFEGFSQRAQEMEMLLKGDDCTLIFVTTPQRYLLTETKKFQERISGYGFRYPVTIINRVLPELSQPFPLDRLKRAGADRATMAQWESAYQAIAKQVSTQNELIASLKSGGRKVLAVRQVDYEIASLTGLESLASQLESSGLFAGGSSSQRR